ncbi:hypothetical protein FOL47_007734 [Perkinsus chesapeaki]|uniref:Uncharacterized protein n=1 Tax=Perkinsus chesapeaki TaxID=330153 RepID=A0A7J6LIE7_PERCH|nr:hypothetical protein FOL47_007734 [Perkinsus chesapeaki]
MNRSPPPSTTAPPATTTTNGGRPVHTVNSSPSSTPPHSGVSADDELIDKGIIPNIAKGYEPRLQTINEGSLDMDFLAEKTRETYQSLSTLQNLTEALEDSSKAFSQTIRGELRDPAKQEPMKFQQQPERYTLAAHSLTGLGQSIARHFETVVDDIERRHLDDNLKVAIKVHTRATERALAEIIELNRRIKVLQEELDAAKSAKIVADQNLASALSVRAETKRRYAVTREGTGNVGEAMEKSLKGILKSIDAKVDAAEKNQMDCVSKVDSLTERLEELIKIRAKKQGSLLALIDKCELSKFFTLVDTAKQLLAIMSELAENIRRSITFSDVHIRVAPLDANLEQRIFLAEQMEEELSIEDRAKLEQSSALKSAEAYKHTEKDMLTLKEERIVLLNDELADVRKQLDELRQRDTLGIMHAKLNPSDELETNEGTSPDEGYDDHLLCYTFPLPLPKNDEQSFLVHEMHHFKVAVAEKHQRLHVLPLPVLADGETPSRDLTWFKMEDRQWDLVAYEMLLLAYFKATDDDGNTFKMTKDEKDALRESIQMCRVRLRISATLHQQIVEMLLPDLNGHKLCPPLDVRFRLYRLLAFDINESRDMLTLALLILEIVKNAMINFHPSQPESWKQMLHALNDVMQPISDSDGQAIKVSDSTLHYPSASLHPLLPRLWKAGVDVKGEGQLHPQVNDLASVLYNVLTRGAYEYHGVHLAQSTWLDKCKEQWPGPAAATIEEVITPGFVEQASTELFKSFRRGADEERDNRHILEEQYDECCMRVQTAPFRDATVSALCDYRGQLQEQEKSPNAVLNAWKELAERAIPLSTTLLDSVQLARAHSSPEARVDWLEEATQYVWRACFELQTAKELKSVTNFGNIDAPTDHNIWSWALNEQLRPLYETIAKDEFLWPTEWIPEGGSDFLTATVVWGRYVKFAVDTPDTSLLSLMVPKLTAALNARLEAFEDDVVSKTCIATSQDGSRWTPTRPPAVRKVLHSSKCVDLWSFMNESLTTAANTVPISTGVTIPIFNNYLERCIVKYADCCGSSPAGDEVGLVFPISIKASRAFNRIVRTRKDERELPPAFKQALVKSLEKQARKDKFWKRGSKKNIPRMYNDTAAARSAATAAQLQVPRGMSQDYSDTDDDQGSMASSSEAEMAGPPGSSSSDLDFNLCTDFVLIDTPVVKQFLEDPDFQLPAQMVRLQDIAKSHDELTAMRGTIHASIVDEEKRIRKVLKTQNKYSTNEYDIKLKACERDNKDMHDKSDEVVNETMAYLEKVGHNISCVMAARMVYVDLNEDIFRRLYCTMTENGVPVNLAGVIDGVTSQEGIASFLARVPELCDWDILVREEFLQNFVYAWTYTVLDLAKRGRKFDSQAMHSTLTNDADTLPNLAEFVGLDAYDDESDAHRIVKEAQSLPVIVTGSEAMQDFDKLAIKTLREPGESEIAPNKDARGGGAAYESAAGPKTVPNAGPANPAAAATGVAPSTNKKGRVHEGKKKFSKLLRSSTNWIYIRGAATAAVISDIMSSSKLAQVSAEATAAAQEGAAAAPPTRRLEWMYDPGVGVTKTDLELMNEAVDTSGGQNDDVKKMQAGEVSGSIFLNDVTHPNSDTMRRLNEDPLFQIKKKEMEAMEQQMNNPLVQMRLRQMEELKAMKKKMKKEHAKEEKRKEKKKLKREAHRTKSESRSDTDERRREAASRRGHHHHHRSSHRDDRSRSRSRDRRRHGSIDRRQRSSSYHKPEYRRESPRRGSQQRPQYNKDDRRGLQDYRRPREESRRPVMMKSEANDEDLRKSLGLGEMSDRRKMQLEKEEQARLRHEAALRKQRNDNGKSESSSSKSGGMSAEEMLQAGKERWSEFEKQVSREEELEKQVAAAEEKAKGHNKYASDMAKRMHFSDDLTLEARLKNQRARRMKTSELKDTLED